MVRYNNNSEEKSSTLKVCEQSLEVENGQKKSRKGVFTPILCEII